MSAAGSRELIGRMVDAVAASGRRARIARFAIIDNDAADWLDRQGCRVLVRRAGPGEYIISRRVRK